MTAAGKNLLLAGVICVQLPAAAAEWSVAPRFAWDADHQSNRTLRDGEPSSQSVGASLDLAIERASERSQFSLVPHARARRFSDDLQGDTNDYTVTANLRQEYERALLDVGATFADESTLTTELSETGAISADARRRTQGAQVGWRFEHASSRRFEASANFQDVDYSGAYTGILFDYRYASLSLGESFTISPRSAFGITGFATALDSPERGSESREKGAALQYDFAWTEHTSMTLSLGASRRDVDGDEHTGTNGALSLNHLGETGEWTLGVSRSLVPFGTGVLTQRDSVDLMVLEDFGPRLRGALRASYARNSDAGAGFIFDGRTYRTAEAELSWQLTETWAVSGVGGYGDAIELGAPQRVDGWRVALRSTWAPSRRVFGH
jgi:hypothetical protein